MVYDNQPMVARVLHCMAHDLRIHHRAAVIADCHGACFLHIGHFGKLFTAGTASDGADGVYASKPGFPGFLDDVSRDRCIVVHGFCIGHRADGCESASDRGGRATLDGLFVLFAWLPQVHVKIDKSGANYQSIGIDHLGSGPREACADRGYRSIGDQDVDDLVPALGGIYDSARLYQELHSPTLPTSRNRIAIRTATPLAT